MSISKNKDNFHSSWVETARKLLQQQYQQITHEDYLHKTLWRSPADGPHPWSDFRLTDPKKHGSNFQYLIHAVRPYENIDPSVFVEHFFQKPTVSMSLIKDSQLDTFYNIGFILDVPCENIVAARPHDLAGAILNGKSTSTEYLAAIKEVNDIWGVFSPEDIFKYLPVSGGNYSEVYAKTGYKYSTDGKIKIMGIYQNKPGLEFMKNLTHKWSSILSVPIIDLGK